MLVHAMCPKDVDEVQADETPVTLATLAAGVDHPRLLPFPSLHGLSSIVIVFPLLGLLLLKRLSKIVEAHDRLTPAVAQGQPDLWRATPAPRPVCIFS